MINEHGKIDEVFIEDGMVIDVFEDGQVLITDRPGLKSKRTIRKEHLHRMAKSMLTTGASVVAGAAVRVITSKISGK